MESAKHSDHHEEPAYVVGQVFFAVFKMGMSRCHYPIQRGCWGCSDFRMCEWAQHRAAGVVLRAWFGSLFTTNYVGMVF